MNHEHQILALGLGLTAPWKLVSSELDTDKNPFELNLQVEAERGALYPCPTCNKPCKAHDFKEFTWRHLNFFQHRTYLTARVPRTSCPEHGVLRARVPWAREGNAFTLLFEEVIVTLCRQMPMLSVAKYVGVNPKSVTRIVEHYVEKGIEKLDLSELQALALDETASKRGHKYITVFADMERRQKPVVYACEGRGKACVASFAKHLQEHGGSPDKVMEVVCDMSPAFLAGVGESLPNAALTVDWFHIVQLFTRAMDEVRKKEAALLKQGKTSMPKATRWALMKGANLSDAQRAALEELEQMGLHVVEAWRCKESLRWVRQAESEQAAKWRLTRFFKYFDDRLRGALLAPMQKALRTLRCYQSAVLRIWKTGFSTARLESLNSLFQAARSRARGYRTSKTFIMMVYLIGADLGDVLST